MNRANIPLLIQFQIYRHSYSQKYEHTFNFRASHFRYSGAIHYSDRKTLQYPSGPYQYLGYAPILMTSNLYQHPADLRHLSINNGWGL